MNVLIADSGASKTDWALIGEEQQFIQTEGLNPHLLTAKEFVHILSRELKPNLMGRVVGKIYFFGSGCGADFKKEEVKMYLEEIFEFAEIHVGTDLDGAGKALLGDKAGLVGIIGTGSSAGFYDGDKVVKQMPAPNYPEGDKGSGTDIGGRVFTAWLNEELPEELAKSLESHMNLELEELFYLLQQPAKTKEFLSGISKLMGTFGDHYFMKKVIRQGFDEFFQGIEEFFFMEEIREICFAGSVADVYRDLLKEAAESHGYTVSNVTKNPIQGLVNYYTSSSSSHL